MDAHIRPEVLRLLRRLERKGRIISEQTDDGPRFTIWGAHNG